VCSSDLGMEDLLRPRPGHGDLSGSLKYLVSVRAILERASARETVARVAAGALAKQLLAPLGITAFGYVVQVGPLVIEPKPGTLEEQCQRRDQSIMYTLNPEQDDQIKTLVDQCQRAGDTLGGVIEIRVEGVPFGLGSHAQWDRKLDGRLAQAVMSVQAMKGVEIGLGFAAARSPGSEVHDPIQYDPSLASTPSLGFKRPHNHAGGLEAGMTNTQPIVIRVAKKPISTLARPLESVNLRTRQPESAAYERSDVCAVSAASVIVENVVAFEIARAVVEKFGGDSLEEIQGRWKLFHEMARKKLGQE
jgi:chorismate synthase